MKYTNFILTIIAILLLVLCFKLTPDRYYFHSEGVTGLAVFDKATGKIYAIGGGDVEEINVIETAGKIRKNRKK